MARSRRLASAGLTYHVVNRGNERQAIFRGEADYTRFRALLLEGTRRDDVELFGHCLMPNHFHLLLRPQAGNALSAYMQWVCCRYACYLRVKTQTMGYGHVFQRRFWSAPIVDDDHFRIVLRYIEANPARAGLVPYAEDWPWNSLADRLTGRQDLAKPLPLDLPDAWCALVNLAQPDRVLARIREELQSTRRRRVEPL